MEEDEEIKRTAKFGIILIAIIIVSLSIWVITLLTRVILPEKDTFPVYLHDTISTTVERQSLVDTIYSNIQPVNIKCSHDDIIIVTQSKFDSLKQHVLYLEVIYCDLRERVELLECPINMGEWFTQPFIEDTITVDSIMWLPIGARDTLIYYL